MAVVINEFEVVDTAPAAPHGAGEATVASPAAPLPEPEDLRRLLAICAELQLRRCGH